MVFLDMAPDDKKQKAAGAAAFDAILPAARGQRTADAGTPPCRAAITNRSTARRLPHVRPLAGSGVAAFMPVLRPVTCVTARRRWSAQAAGGSVQAEG
jgi:hypothetical protein